MIYYNDYLMLILIIKLILIVKDEFRWKILLAIICEIKISLAKFNNRNPSELYFLHNQLALLSLIKSI